jgi:hypothetical protein
MSSLSRLLGILFFLAIGSLIPLPARAQWIGGGTVPVCVAPGQQTQPDAVSDGFGGVVVAWLDCRYGCSSIFAQRLDALGYPRWGVNGVRVGGPPADQENVVIAADGKGGAIIAWIQSGPDLAGETSRNAYAQRIDAAGYVAWSPAGVVLCNARYSQEDPIIVADGAGGAIIAWNDWRRSIYNPGEQPRDWDDVFAQRVDSAGTLQWDALGKPIAYGDRWSYLQGVIPDGEGGAIFAYLNVAQGLGYGNLHAQKVSAAGTALWDIRAGEDWNDPAYFAQPRLITDGAAGAILTWWRQGTAEVVGQWIDHMGALHWGSPYKGLLAGVSSFEMASDMRGGAIVRWDTLAQRFNQNGDAVWAPGGIDAGIAGVIISDGAAGAIIGNGAVGGGAVQRVDALGSVLWGPAGIPTSAGKNMRLISDNALGVIQVYGNQDIYALRVNQDAPSGSLALAPILRLLQNHPNPFNSLTTIPYDVPSEERVTIDVYNVNGQRVARIVDARQSGGRHTIDWNGRDDRGRHVTSGIYFYRVSWASQTLSRKMILLR